MLRSFSQDERQPQPLDHSIRAHKPRSGRPRVLTPKLQAEILCRIAKGETLKGICESCWMPTRQTVGNCARRDPGFRAALDFARQNCAAVLDRPGRSVSSSKH